MGKIHGNISVASIQFEFNEEYDMSVSGQFFVGKVENLESIDNREVKASLVGIMQTNSPDLDGIYTPKEAGFSIPLPFGTLDIDIRQQSIKTGFTLGGTKTFGFTIGGHIEIPRLSKK